MQPLQLKKIVQMVLLGPIASLTQTKHYTSDIKTPSDHMFTIMITTLTSYLLSLLKAIAWLHFNMLGRVLASRYTVSH